MGRKAIKVVDIISPVSRGWSTATLLRSAFASLGINAQCFFYRREAGLMVHQRTDCKDKLTLLLKDSDFGEDVLGQLHHPLICWSFDFDHEPVPKTVAWVDLYFTMCRDFIAPKIQWLPQATDPYEFKPTQSMGGGKSDILFIGSPKPPRAMVMEKLKAEFGQGVHSIGEGWVIGEPGAYFNDFNEAVGQSIINLALNSYSNLPQYESTWSQRVYMLAACEAFILFEYVKGIEEFFTSDEIVTFRTFDELVELCKIYLKPEMAEARRSYGKQARERVIRDHTYVHRIKEMLKWVEEL